jgi:hypothetical protein
MNAKQEISGGILSRLFLFRRSQADSYLQLPAGQIK